jgi:hypothetical protein
MPVCLLRGCRQTDTLRMGKPDNNVYVPRVVQHEWVPEFIGKAQILRCLLCDYWIPVESPPAEHQAVCPKKERRRADGLFDEAAKIVGFQERRRSRLDPE